MAGDESVQSGPPESEMSRTEAYFALLRVRATGKTTFRNPEYGAPGKIAGILIYPVIMFEMLIAPVVWLALATVFHWWVPYWQIISAIIAWGTALVFVIYGVSLLFGM